MTDVISRRSFFRKAGVGVSGLVVAPWILSACGSPSKSVAGTNTNGTNTKLDVVRQADGWLSNVELAGIFIAMENGYLTDNGVKSDILAGGPNAPAPEVMLAAGSSNIGMEGTMLRIFQAMNKSSEDWVLFATQYQTSPDGIISLPSHPVRTAADLVGIKILMQPGAENMVNAALVMAGLKPNSYQNIPTGFTPEPLMKGVGQAFTAFLTNQPITLEQQGYVEGKDFITTSYSDLGVPLYANVYFTTRTYAEKHHDVLVRYMRAVIKGYEVNEDDPTLAADLAVNKYSVDLGLNLKQQITENKLQIPFMQSPWTDTHGMFTLDPDLIKNKMYPVLKIIGIDPLPDIDKLLDLSILKDAYAGKTSMR